MTTTTVEVEEMRTIEEAVDVCDDCNREVDDAGVEYRSHGKPTLHFCSECLSSMSDDYTEPHVERVEDWMAETANDGTTMYQTLVTSRKFGAAAFLVATFVFMCGFLLPFVSMVWAIYVACINLAIGLFVVIAMTTAVERRGYAYFSTDE